MGRHNKHRLPKYLEQHTASGLYYYKNIQAEQRATRLEASVDLGSPRFDIALEVFIEKYIVDYRWKSFSVHDDRYVRELPAEYGLPRRRAA